jgi:hypothetical protein
MRHHTPRPRRLIAPLWVFTLCLSVAACQPFEDTSQYAFEGDPDATSADTSGTSGTSGTTDPDATSADTSGGSFDTDLDPDGIDPDGIDPDGIDPDGNLLDTDSDGILDDVDNCVFIFNPFQEDADLDGIGDACANDPDGDGTPDDIDNCPTIPNPDQTDINGNGIGDACEDIIVPSSCYLVDDFIDPMMRKYHCDYKADTVNTMSVYVPISASTPPSARPVVAVFPSPVERLVVFTDNRAYEVAYQIASRTGAITLVIPYGPEANDDVVPFIESKEFIYNGARALQWIHHNAAAFGGDPNHIIATGHTTGGTLALLLSRTTQWFADLGELGEDATVPSVHGVIAIAPLLEFENTMAPGLSLDVKSVFGLPAGVEDNLWRELDAVLRPNGEVIVPPTLIIAPGNNISGNAISYLSAQAFVFANIARVAHQPVNMLQPIINASFDGVEGTRTVRRNCFLFMNPDQLLDILISDISYAPNSRVNGQVYSESGSSCSQEGSAGLNNGMLNDHPFEDIVMSFILAPYPEFVFAQQNQDLDFSHHSTTWQTTSDYRFNVGGAQFLEPSDGWQRLAPPPLGVNATSLAVAAGEARSFVTKGRVMVNDALSFSPVVASTSSPPMPVMHFQLVPALGEDYVQFVVKLPEGALTADQTLLNLNLTLSSVEGNNVTGGSISVEAQGPGGFITITSGISSAIAAGTVLNVPLLGVPVFNGDQIVLKVKRVNSNIVAVPSVAGLELTSLRQTLPPIPVP